VRKLACLAVFVWGAWPVVEALLLDHELRRVERRYQRGLEIEAEGRGGAKP
jgi:uncharacterized membrane protein YccC